MPTNPTDHLETRVGILEVQMSTVQDAIGENTSNLNNYGRRFDDYVKDELKSSAYVNQAITKVSNTVENLTNEISRTNTNIKDFISKMEDTHETVNDWKVAWTLIYKASGVIAIIIGAAWALFKFFHGV